MGFIDLVEETLNEDFNEKRTENGAVGYRTTGKKLLDLNFKVATLRQVSPSKIINDFDEAFMEDKLYAIKWLFYLRDVRGGLGERRTFRIILSHLAKTEPQLVKKMIKLIAEYGRYDDLFCLIYSECENDVISFIKEQLKKDIADMESNKPISLLAKWLPSANASSKETKELAAYFRKRFGIDERKYRKMLSLLRKHIDIVERKMSANQWSEIDYESVPSKANVIYRKAFLKNDEERRTDFLKKVSAGDSKINSAVNFPHDIVHGYNDRTNLCSDESLEVLWKALPDMVKGNNNTLVVRDGSYSMTCTVEPKSRLEALDVSTAIAIYFSERCTGEFKNKFITFSSKPKIVSLSDCKTLRDKIKKCYLNNDCSNTNIEATFDLILKTAIKNNMDQSDMPKNILVVSDMEFDAANRSNQLNSKLFNLIKKDFEEAGYKLPRLVFWNVNSRTTAIPLRENNLGVALVSGFSTNIVKMVLSDKLDPYECLTEELDNERYKPVEDAIKSSL